MSSPDGPSTSEPDAQPAAPPKRLSRRSLLRRLAAGTVATGAASFLYAWRIEPHWVEIVERPLPIVGLPPALAGKRLVQLSDLHAGPVVDQSFLLASMDSVAALKPDLIVLTGDYMTCHADEQIDHAMEVIAELPKAPLGRIAILGNHDYGHYWRQDAVAGKLIDRLEQHDVQLLRNLVTDVEGLQIVGVDDVWGSNFQPQIALADVDAARPAIALCHNPDGVDHPAWQSFQGWILAGHTHGGQCKPPFMAPPVLPVHNRLYTSGEYELAAGRRMYINRGLGYLERVRFNCRPEITVFTLQQAEA